MNDDDRWEATATSAETDVHGRRHHIAGGGREAWYQDGAVDAFLRGMGHGVRGRGSRLRSGVGGLS